MRNRQKKENKFCKLRDKWYIKFPTPERKRTSWVLDKYLKMACLSFCSITFIVQSLTTIDLKCRNMFEQNRGASSLTQQATLIRARFQWTSRVETNVRLDQTRSPISLTYLRIGCVSMVRNELCMLSSGKHACHGIRFDFVTIWNRVTKAPMDFCEFRIRLFLTVGKLSPWETWRSIKNATENCKQFFKSFLKIALRIFRSFFFFFFSFFQNATKHANE